MRGEIPAKLTDRQGRSENNIVLDRQLQKFRRRLWVVDRSAAAGPKGQHGTVEEVPQTGPNQLNSICFAIDVGNWHCPITDRLINNRHPDLRPDLKSR